MDGRKRIAIYGGSFDPVHRGHVQVAKRTVELFGLDSLLFVPARQAPHKLEREVTSPLHRYAMLALATKDDPRLRVSTFELDAPDRRYTIDTVAHFREVFGDAELFFVMGADSWAEITTWREWRRLIETTNHIVVTRPGYELKSEPAVSASIVDVRGWDAAAIARTLNEAKSPTVYLTDAAMDDVSATVIREAARANRQEVLRELLPPPVADYVVKYLLYKNSNEI